MDHSFLLEDSKSDNTQATDYPLHQAIKDENIAAIFRIRSKKQINPNQHNREGQTPLWCAVNTLNLEIINAILHFNSIDPNQKNTCPNKESAYQDTPLRLAMSYHDATIIAKLIKAKADPHQQYIHLKNTPDGHGRTPFDSAKNQGDALVIQAFENPTAKEFNVITERTIKDLCKVLEEKSSDQDAHLFIATRLKSIKSTPKVALKKLINTYDAHGHLPLYWAIKCDLAHDDQTFQCTRLLMGEGADSNTLNRRQETLLYSIIKETKSVDAVKVLLKEGGAYIKNNGDQNNPFHIAAKLKRPDIIQQLNQHLEEDQERLRSSKNYQMATPRQLAQKDTDTLAALNERLKTHSNLATIGEEDTENEPYTPSFRR